MAGITDKLSTLPKWALFSVIGIVAGVFIFLIYSSFAPEKDDKEDTDKSVVISVPDAPEKESSESLLQVFDNNKASQKGRSAMDYWDDLASQDKKRTDALGQVVTDDLDPSVYSELDIQYIKSGMKTREEVDREHMEKAREEAEAARERQIRFRTPEQEDSVYMARLERSYQLAAKYSQQRQPVEETPVPVEDETPKESFRKIEFEEDEKASVLPSDVLSGDGIISSLDVEPQAAGGNMRTRPVKATFLKTEKLTSGERVIIRLMQDLQLSNGTLIPANTHITGTCDVRGRMKINVTMLHYGGKMFPVDLSVYDNDGTEGLYCPATETRRRKKNKTAETVGEVVTGAGSTVGSLLTGNPLLGITATSGLRSVSSDLGDDGTPIVTVSAGYEFYIFENLPEEK